MKEHYKILELASEAKLPEQIDETFELPVEIVTELIEAGYLKAIDASSFDGTAYLQTRITLSGREYLKDLRSQSKGGQKIMAGSKIRLFISHSSIDSEFVQALVELLRAALSLPSTQIRCTSIDGYRLPGGANTDRQLRQEVHEADSFIGIISFSSIKSLYVVFELGARWGAGRSLIPLIAPGTDTNLLGGPLAGINALSSDNRSQIYQLISDLSSELEITPEPPSSYERHIEAIFNLKSDRLPENAASEGDAIHLNEKEVQILKLLSEQGDYKLDADQLANSTSENITKTKYFLDKLLGKKMVFDLLTMGAPRRYGLTANGRAFLVENSII